MDASTTDLTLQVSDIHAQMSAQGTTINATYIMAQDNQSNGEKIRMSLQDVNSRMDGEESKVRMAVDELNSTAQYIKGDVTDLKQEFAALRAMLMKKFEMLYTVKMRSRYRRESPSGVEGALLLDAHQCFLAILMPV